MQAIPTIASAFDSLKDVGWYGIAFLISMYLVGRPASMR